MSKIADIALISTRPEEFNADLRGTLENSKIEVLSFPLTSINPLDNYALFDSQLENLGSYQHLIFISTNAVHYFVERVKKNKIQLPNKIILSAIGPSTKKRLVDFFNVEVYCPQKKIDSENLTKLKIFDNVEQQNILIVRGIGGREVLKKRLANKGANVDYAECYLRQYLKPDMNSIYKAIQNKSKIYFLITSYESALNFSNNVNPSESDWLSSTYCIANHERTGQALKHLFRKVYIAPDLDHATLEKILLSKNIN